MRKSAALKLDAALKKMDEIYASGDQKMISAISAMLKISEKTLDREAKEAQEARKESR
jgi:hypothetical protein